MESRKVELDFADAKARWNTRNPEFGYFLNSISTTLPYTEPFFVKAARQARALLPESAGALIKETDTFVLQEARHSKLHVKFNRVLHQAGYDHLTDAEARMKSDYERFWAKGLKFSLAYGEGFETIGPIITGYLFEHGEALGLTNWREEPTVFLFVWHMAEEYEHRTTISYLYKELYGGYWYRMYGMWYGIGHIGKYVVRVGLNMIATDSRAEKPTVRLRNQLKFLRVVGRFARFALPRLILTASHPRYDPGRIPPPPGCMELLNEAAEKYGVIA